MAMRCSFAAIFILFAVAVFVSRMTPKGHAVDDHDSGGPQSELTVSATQTSEVQIQDLDRQIQDLKARMLVIEGRKKLVVKP